MDEPDQDPTNGGCVKMQPNFGAWEDSFCNDPAAYVCKKTDGKLRKNTGHLDGDLRIEHGGFL